MSNLLAIDLEITNIIPADYQGSWFDLDLRISCVSSYSAEGEYSWYNRNGKVDGVWSPTGGEMDGSIMLSTLMNLTSDIDDGHTLVSWNGASFDFRVMADNYDTPEYAKELCLSHIDLMLNFWYQHGHRVSLAKVLKGYNMQPKHMHGSSAPKLWAEGKYQEVIDYCEDDARKTLKVAEIVHETSCIRWISRMGFPHVSPMSMLTVKEILEKVSGNRYDIERSLGWLM